MFADDLKLVVKYSIFREKALVDLFSLDDFMNMLAVNGSLYADKYYSRIIIDERRTTHVHHAFTHLVPVFLHNTDNRSKTLDQFKIAALLCFAINKGRPIQSIRQAKIKRYLIDEHITNAERLRRWDMFRSFGDQIIAFDFGFNFCLSYQLQKIASVNPQVRDIIKNGGIELLEFASDFAVRPNTIHDTCLALRENNLEVNALYLIYKNIFENNGELSNVDFLKRSNPRRKTQNSKVPRT